MIRLSGQSLAALYPSAVASVGGCMDCDTRRDASRPLAQS